MTPAAHLLLLSLALWPLQNGFAQAAQAAPARQDPEVLRQVAAQFLQAQATRLPGQVSVTVAPVEPRLSLASCAAPEPFLVGATRPWGKTTVGVRCAAPTAWTVYLYATVRVEGDYLTAAVPLTPGQSLATVDLTRVRGDLTALPAGIVTEPSQAVGRTVASPVAAGTPLRQDLLRSPQAVRSGQTVRLVAVGPGFTISAEARALNNAGLGDLAQVRTASGQVVSGVAKAGGIVEVAH